MLGAHPTHPWYTTARATPTLPATGNRLTRWAKTPGALRRGWSTSKCRLIACSALSSSVSRLM